MYFVNRDSDIKPGIEERCETEAACPLSHSDIVDAFFAAKEQYNPRYRRVFRATDGGSARRRGQTEIR
jgi:hypothetical protein